MIKIVNFINAEKMDAAYLILKFYSLFFDYYFAEKTCNGCNKTQSS